MSSYIDLLLFFWLQDIQAIGAIYIYNYTVVSVLILFETHLQL